MCMRLLSTCTIYRMPKCFHKVTLNFSDKIHHVIINRKQDPCSPKNVIPYVLKSVGIATKLLEVSFIAKIIFKFQKVFHVSVDDKALF